ncbi:uncharacterized protein LOC119556364 isoform X2 [Drosophila subpulchrella]|uniref:uncharacterized protein LOC119556364 isoform X2 n=1 Tax=Drosophila subpulchrella TaxID=1486046 RepID=UPI0018A18EFF|nr:uncharacterized protein LOC119556364 isoform X2 [Drosophila subpulchrella]
MPTMTRMHRHSSSSAVVEESRGRRRGVGVPGAGDANKENFGVHFMSSPFGNASLIALQDLSNVHGKSPQRRSFSEGSGPRQATPQLAALRCLPRSTTTTTTTGGGVLGAVALEDSQLSSSRMGDTTLDRMLDAIIESARKEVRCTKPLGVTSTSTNTTSTTNATILADNHQSGEWSETSVHEMEVRTPTHLKRQRVVRRKNPHKTHTHTQNQNTTQTQSHQNKIKDQLHLIPSTKRCLSFSSSSASSDLDDDEQQVAKRSSLASNSTSSATPPAHSNTTSRNSSNSGADLENSQRGSIDVSIAYDAREQQLNVHVIRCRDLQRSHGSGNGSINAYVKVALSGLGAAAGAGGANQPPGGSGGSMSSGYQRTAVHRHSCRPYFDQRFSFQISSGEETIGQHLQLAVWHRDRHLKRSEFLGCSTFPLNELVHPESGIITAGSYKLQAQACPPPNNRQSQRKRANAGQDRKQEAEKDQEQDQPEDHSPAGMAAAATVTPQKPIATGSGSVSGSAAVMPLNDEVISISIDSMGKEDLLLPQQPQQPMKLSKKALHQRDADENLFLRFLELDPPADGNANSTTQAQTTGQSSVQSTSSKANESNANHLNNGTSGGGRRQSTMPNNGGAGGAGGAGGGGGAPRQQPGRTPFTMTKRLTRTEERGFGFSIVWTHPPRVEKIEAGLSADRCGILPGDYVIFVDKHNVVTMPEADVLNLIRSQGSALTLEIFRRSGAGATTITTADLGQNNTSMSSRLGVAVGLGVGLGVGVGGLGSEEHTLATTTTGTTTVMSLQRTASTRIQPVGNSLSRPATACSGTTSSIEAAKRRLHLPQVTFSKEVGKGVFV